MYWRSFKPSLCASLYNWVKLWQRVLTTPQSGSESEPQSRAHEGGEQRRAQQLIEWLAAFTDQWEEKWRDSRVFTLGASLRPQTDWLGFVFPISMHKACILWNWRVSVKLNVLWWALHWYHSAFHVLIVNWRGMYNVLFQDRNPYWKYFWKVTLWSIYNNFNDGNQTELVGCRGPGWWGSNINWSLYDVEIMALNNHSQRIG